MRCEIFRTTRNGNSSAKIVYAASAWEEHTPGNSFRCPSPGCGGGHDTLMHRPARIGSDSAGHHLEGSDGSAQHGMTARNSTGAGDDAPSNESTVPDGVAVAATKAGEPRVCLAVIPVKVQARGGGPTVMTYALLDNGSEVT